MVIEMTHEYFVHNSIVKRKNPWFTDLFLSFWFQLTCTPPNKDLRRTNTLDVPATICICTYLPVVFWGHHTGIRPPTVVYQVKWPHKRRLLMVWPTLTSRSCSWDPKTVHYTLYFLLCLSCAKPLVCVLFCLQKIIRTDFT